MFKISERKQLEQQLPNDVRIRLLDNQGLRYWTNFALLIAILCGLLAALIHGGSSTVSVTAFGAALGLGGVLGFLFGVPGKKTAVNIVKADSVAFSTGNKSNTTAIDGPDGPSTTHSADSQSEDPLITSTGDPQLVKGPDPTDHPMPAEPSNLEQVADWVTKLLLGGGLTQMQRIPPTVWKWSGLIAIGIAGKSTPASIEAHQAFAAGLLVYGFVLGFFGGFLTTKLQLGQSIWS